MRRPSRQGSTWKKRFLESGRRGSGAPRERRISVLASFHFTRNGEFEDALALAGHFIEDAHPLIPRAAGWMRREVKKRDRGRLKAFLQAPSDLIRTGPIGTSAMDLREVLAEPRSRRLRPCHLTLPK